jgi:cyclopropane-fatty-acyl-phospholipid synthase
MAVSTSVRAAAAIRHHYDIGNDFFRLWLDESLAYSCALRSEAGEANETLETAQRRKIRHHLDAVGATTASSILDIGCGWGSVLRPLAEEYRVPQAVGLTLSDEQAAYVQQQRYPGVRVETQSWTDYQPTGRFDGIISIGAFEHFARPDQTSAEKIEVYRQFFTRCRDWLDHGGVLSLQTVGYANMAPEQANPFMQEIFPDSDLPTLAEIASAAHGVLEICSLRNDRLDYAWTCEQWAQRLRARREEAIALVGPEVVARYERYLRMCAMGFRMGKIGLLRLVLTPYPDGHFRRPEARTR